MQPKWLLSLLELLHAKLALCYQAKLLRMPRKSTERCGEDLCDHTISTKLQQRSREGCLGESLCAARELMVKPNKVLGTS